MGGEGKWEREDEDFTAAAGFSVTMPVLFLPLPLVTAGFLLLPPPPNDLTSEAASRCSPSGS